MHPSLMRWMLRPEPTGRRRFAAAYLNAAAGTAVFLIIFGITMLATDSCQRDPVTGAACLAVYFRGVVLAIIGGLLATLGFAIFLKLGLRFAIGLVALAAPVVLIIQLLSLSGVHPWPYALAVLAGVPAAAAWFTGRLFAPSSPHPPRGHKIPHINGVSWRLESAGVSEVARIARQNAAADQQVADTPHKSAVY
ncbi:hypothetical protein [Microlunatus sp. Gsoil 973]|uniref:hypothetical protein n=1 Tax=Microlunatus sp. Gsoil 973 TaxID=2672569 RepID=UPI0012B4FCF3|nr:hypothetical protein [Microlunatus sp. Gsoil 973]QGN33549.1 hypothetical protein GJV80_12825 [Microlunatus sp. Gsoil 973]